MGEDFAPRVRAPVELVHAKDGDFPAEFARAVAGLFPKGTYAGLDGGHLLPLENPDGVSAHLLSTTAD